MEIKEYCRQLPKIELHAHLNGSLSATTLKALGCQDKTVEEYQKLAKLLNRTDKTLEECFEIFKLAQEATDNADSVYVATKSVIEDFRDDNVIYLELRTTPRQEKEMTKADYIESVVRAIRDSSADGLMVKLLLSIDRRHDWKTSEDSVQLFIEMKNKYPDIVKGVDFSGDPMTGCFNKNLFKQAKENGLYTTLHCGEVPNNDEVLEILKFGPDRIGHGTCLHPNYGGSEEIWRLFRYKKIPTEYCLTSNVVCGTSKSYKDHHLGVWIKNELPFTLSTDDKGVFCTSLSQELIHAAENFGLTRSYLWHISYNSVDYSFASPQEKLALKQALQDWKAKTQF